MSISFFSMREKAKNDACLDSFLSFLLIELETHGLFEKGISSAVAHTPFPLREHVEQILTRFTERGMSMDESLELFSNECNTPLCERTSGLLRHLYAHGCTHSAIDALKQLAEDVRTHQRVVWKAYAQKLVLLSLVFIGISALVPALFLAFVTIGSRFLDMSLSTGDITFISWVGFPVLDILVLGIVWVQTPAIPRMNTNSFYWKSFSFSELFSGMKKNVDTVIKANGRTEGFSSIVYSSAVEGAGLFIVAWSIFLRENKWSALWVTIFLAAIMGPLFVNILWHYILFERNTQKLEEQAADSLLILSSIPPSVSFVGHLEWLAKVSPSPIKKTWEKMVARLRSGKLPQSVFEKLGVGRNSPILNSVRALLIRTYESGHVFGQPARTLAQEIIFHHASIQERRAVLLVEKYTLLLAGGLLVPFLLGILTGVVSALPWSTMTELTSPNAGMLFETALWGMRGYLAVYAILAGVFVGLQDGQPVQGLAYSVILLPLAQVVYALGEWWTAS